VKKIFILVLCCFLLVGCSGTKIPEGINNKSFYKDMVKTVELAEKALEHKNVNYVNDIGELIRKHTDEYLFEMLHGDIQESEEMKNNFGFSEKEQLILGEVLAVHFSLLKYITDYLDGRDIRKDVFIDLEDFGGSALYADLQKLIGVLEIKYNVTHFIE
jgi:hypothetical protein